MDATFLLVGISQLVIGICFGYLASLRPAQWNVREAKRCFYNTSQLELLILPILAEMVRVGAISTDQYLSYTEKAALPPAGTDGEYGEERSGGVSPDLSTAEARRREMNRICRAYMNGELSIEAFSAQRDALQFVIRASMFPPLGPMRNPSLMESLLNALFRSHHVA